MGKSRTQTQTTNIDPASQAYINKMRTAGAGAANGIMNGGPFFTGPQTQSIEDQVSPFMNPYINQVVDATRGEFDHLRSGATMDANAAATRAGAFGDARHGVAEGTRLGAVDRAQASTIADLLKGGYDSALSTGLGYAEHQRQLKEQQMQEPVWRAQQGMNMWNLGMGPTGSTTTTKQPGNLFGDIAGLGMMAGGLGLFGNTGPLASLLYPRGGVAG